MRFRNKAVLGVFLLAILFFELSYGRNLLKSDSVPTTAVNGLNNLFVPWDLSILGDGRIIFTQRDGKVFIYDPKLSKVDEIYVDFNGLEVLGEGGLLGLAVDPEFEKNMLVYLYYTHSSSGELRNRVDSFEFSKSNLVRVGNVIDKIPAGEHHNGGRIAFGPDDYLYIATGDTTDSGLAQNIESLAGKILRVNKNGDVPSDNPFGESPIFSLGHRNVQGLAWDSESDLWATEHGADGKDELNRVIKGGNYGWPVVEGSVEKEGFIKPVVNSEADTWAPTGITTNKNNIYFVGLAGRAIYKYDLEQKNLVKYPSNEYGRLREIEYDKARDVFWLLTSNLDGRNKSPHKDDDRLFTLGESELNLP